MRIAAIDIGTNSIHMVIARATRSAGLEVLDREREVVQIGKNSFRSGRLHRDAMNRTVDALVRYVRLARSHRVHRILCTATAAVREAENGGDFLTAARDASGVDPRIIPAEVEGQFIYLAVKHALELDAEPSVVVDIGGGSMQLVVGNNKRCHQVVSAPLGALRLQETMIHDDPPSSREISKLREHIERCANEAIKTVLGYRPARVYGSSGSIHALAETAHWLETGNKIEHINGHVLSTVALDQLTRRLRRIPAAERQKLRGLDSKRAEIIVPAAMLLTHLLKELGASGITLSDFSLREGLVIDFVAHHPDELRTHEESDLRLRSVLQLLTRMNHQKTHPQHVARLAIELFNGMWGIHGLSTDARSLLHYAALLHDIGSVVGYDKHAEHSYYIIKNGNLRAFDGDEIDILANTARYHSKRKPRKSDPEFANLSRDSRRTVRWLAAILRLAEALDRSHYQLIDSLRVVSGRRSLTILVSSRRNVQLELWAGQRRVDLLEKLVGVPIRLEMEESSTAGGRPAPVRAKKDASSESAGSSQPPAASPRGGTGAGASSSEPASPDLLPADGPSPARAVHEESKDRESSPTAPESPLAEPSE